MGTPFSAIFKRFVSKIDDVQLIGMEPEDINRICANYLDAACALFTNCYNDLSQRSDDDQTFNIELSPLEIEILSCIMVFSWIDPQINKITLLRQNLSDGDFRIHSQANHLKELIHLRDKTEERYNHLMVEYSYSSATQDIIGQLGDR